ncbi:MAG: family 20 glycosylhydrolase [Pyrinomonadaceae bacterium]
MKIRYIASLFLLLLFAPVASAQESSTLQASRRNLMPVPAHVEFQAGRLALDKSFRVAVKAPTDDRLRPGIERALKRLEGRTGLEFAPYYSNDESGARLLVQTAAPGKIIPSVDEDESYTLEVTNNQARLVAPTVIGVLRGLETLLQLVEGDAAGYYLPAVKISDRPRFPWRGLLIDSSRHFQTIEHLKRELDGMAAVKLNVFHWHLTENQGFRIESRKYPRLHLMGSDGLYYTQEQARDIIKYAQARGIRVIPEFDMPGHTTAWFVGHPEMASAPGPYQIERQWGIFDPAMDPTNEEVYKILDGFIGEMAALFPDDYLHIGGDEVNGKQWDANPKIQAFMKAHGLKDNHALQAYFNQRLSKIIQKYHKKIIGWDEVLHPDLPKSIVVQSWRGPESLAQAAKNGYTGILSSGYYLDLMLPTSEHYLADPIAANSDLTQEQLTRVLGGEACMWSEYVSTETIDSRIWPRLAAIAERLWSPRDVTDVSDMYRRLAATSVRLEELGLTHRTYEEKMLRRLAADEDIEPLKTLVNVVEPIKVYTRGQAHPTNQLSPLTSLVDAARADPDEGRRVKMMVEDLLSDSPRFLTQRDALSQIFSTWRDARVPLQVMMQKSPILQEAGTLPADLSDLGAAGAEALEYLSTGIAPPPNWMETKLARIDEAAKQKAAVEFSVTTSIRQLVYAASELPRLKTMTPPDWKKHVMELAKPRVVKEGNED